MGEHDLDTEKDCEEIDEDNFSCAEPVQNILVEKIITHQEYNKGEGTLHENDIALLRLASPAIRKGKFAKIYKYKLF